MQEIQAGRNRKKFDPTHHTKLINYILDSCKDQKLKIQLVFALVNSLFDQSKFQQSGFLPRETWIEIHKQLIILSEMVE